MAGAVCKYLVAGWLAVGALAAQSADFSVGRVEVTFADDGWKEVVVPDSKRPYTGDKGGALDVQSRLYVRDAGLDSQVLVLVSAASSGLAGRSHMTYSGDCDSDENNYREGTLRQASRQCLTVTPLYSRDSVYRALAPDVLRMEQEGALLTKRPVYTVWNSYAISTGTFVDVRVFVTAPMAVDGTSVSEKLPDGVPSAHVLWGRQLSDAIRSSAHSLSGRLAIPAIQLTPLPPPPAQPSKSAAAA